MYCLSFSSSVSAMSRISEEESESPPESSISVRAPAFTSRIVSAIPRAFSRCIPVERESSFANELWPRSSRGSCRSRWRAVDHVEKPFIMRRVSMFCT